MQRQSQVFVPPHLILELQALPAPQVLVEHLAPLDLLVLKDPLVQRVLQRVQLGLQAR